MIEPLVIPAVNRVLRRNSWSLERLRVFAGRTARVVAPPFIVTFTVLMHGELSAAAADAAPESTITLTPGVALRLLARDESVWRDVEVAGDTDFATALNQVWRNLRWDIEEDLSQVFGDIAAHRMVQAGKALDRWRAQSFDNLAHSLSEYWTEEQPLIARRHDVDQFNREVDRLRDDAARLEKRLRNIIPSRQTTSERPGD